MILWGVQLCKIEAKVFRLERKMVWKLNINRRGESLRTQCAGSLSKKMRRGALHFLLTKGSGAMAVEQIFAQHTPRATFAPLFYINISHKKQLLFNLIIL